MDVVLGTAGHIDHGKTSLVRALTGINCDRLSEEKKRGITIELGFAWLDLPDGKRLGIVDVPGHERFVKNMVAGASGIDCMALVVAADEGMMPQTREHMDICALLGVRRGIVALTKCDMVDADWLEMVQEDVAASLAGTFLEGAPIFPVSSATGQGLDALRQGICELVASLPPRRDPDIFRLPADRVFTLKGFGTVVTGTIVSGSCNEGEDVVIMPAGIGARARTLQVHSQPAVQARQGQRCAMNLQGVEVTNIERGDVIARPGTLFPSRRWIVRLACLESSPLPIRQRMEVHFHHGTRECMARIVFRDRMELAPGETALAEIHLHEALPAIFGDHCVARAHSPLRAIAGGVIIDPLPPLLRKRDPLFPHKFTILQKLGELAAQPSANLTEQAETLASLALELCPPPGADNKRLAVLTGLPAPALANALNAAVAKGAAILWDGAARWYIDKNVFDECIKKACLRARELHTRDPLKMSFAPNALLTGWGENLPSRFCQCVLETAVKAGLLAQESNGMRLASYKTRMNTDTAALLEQIICIYEHAGAAPPTLKELEEQTGRDARQLMPLLGHLCETGQLMKIQEGLYYFKPEIERILAAIKEWFASHATLDVGNMKEILNISRKYAIPLLEYMDAIRMTYRSGNERKLRQ